MLLHGSERTVAGRHGVTRFGGRAHGTTLVFGHRCGFHTGRQDDGNQRQANEAGQKTSRGLRDHDDTLID